MNIFKVLAQGDGTINEPNVSAFLGYLLNPGEDHGLDSLFLEAFLQVHYNFCKGVQKSPVVLSKKREEDPLEWLLGDFRTSGKYEVKVFFEQAFKNLVAVDNPTADKKEIVDIIIVIHELDYDDNKTESKFQSYLSKKRTLKHIFLVEVKISDTACKPGKNNDEGQLELQIKKSIDLVSRILPKEKVNIKKKLSAIFISQGQPFIHAKEAFVKSYNYRDITLINKSHLFWNFPKEKSALIRNDFNRGQLKTDYITFIDFQTKDEESDDTPIFSRSIENILDEIIYPQKKYKQQPIPQYTIDTIKSFSNYIYSDFNYKFKRPVREREFHSLLEIKKAINNHFTPALWTILENFLSYVKLPDITSPMFGSHHIISFSYLKSGQKFADITRVGKNKIYLKLKWKFSNELSNEENLEFTKHFFESIPSQKGEHKKIDSYYALPFDSTVDPKWLVSILNKYFEIYCSIMKKIKGTSNLTN